MEQIDADIEDWKNFLSFIDECTDDYIYILSRRDNKD